MAPIPQSSWLVQPLESRQLRVAHVDVLAEEHEAVSEAEHLRLVLGQVERHVGFLPGRNGYSEVIGVADRWEAAAQHGVVKARQQEVAQQG